MKKLFLRLGFMALVILFSQSEILAQTDVSGVVTDSNGDPLIGASVIVKGTTVGTITDIDGSYRLTAPAGATELEVSYLGFGSSILSIADGNYGSIMLSEDSNQLDEIVITGLGTTVQRKNLANSVAKVDAAALTAVAPASTVESALYGKFKGAEIKAASGAPGGGVSFKLRGLTSINGSSQPLVIIDGIYMDNSSTPAGLNIVSAAAGGGSTSNQDNPSNRLSDLSPEDIESVEILKGASAAAIYGSRAAGGVVIITTKRGEAGKTKVTISQSLGQTSQLRKLGIRDWTEERVLNSAFAGAIDDFRNNGITNYEDLLYGNKGALSNTRLSMSGGSNDTKFYFGMSHKDEEGIVTNTGYRKTSARLNIDHKLSDMFDVSVSTNYINSSADRGFFNNDNSGTTMGISFTSTPAFASLEADPATGLFPSNPYAPSNFLETAALVTNNEGVNRFLGGATLTAKLFTTDKSSFKVLLRGGSDFYTLNTTALFPNSLQFQRDGAGLNGVSVQGTTTNLNTNIAAIAVHSYYGDRMSFTTSGGVTQEDFNRNTILGEATNLIGAETNLDQAGNRNVTQGRRIQQDKGFFIQEEINFGDKILATLGVRGDKSSNNSDVNQLYFYPKANVAVNLHNLGLLPSDGMINLLKLRVAYGESGNFARFGAKSTILNSTIVDGQAGVIVPTLLGNASVGPERQKELEFGVDLGLANRISLDATYYIKNVEDLLLNADVPSSTGFSQQVTNAAQMQNRGIELGLNIGVINNENLTWGSRIGWWKNQAEVTELLVPAFTTGGFADFLGNFLVKEGFSPTTIIGVGPNPDVTLNGDGEPTLQIFGNAEPDFQMSWANNISMGNLDFTFLWHWKNGGSNINLSTLLFDLNETTHDFDDMGVDPNGELANGPYRLSVLGANTEPYIEDASYLRLREVGLYYTIPATFINGADNLKIGVSGNNLLNFFSYNSYDPEVSNFGSGGLSTGVEVTPFPSSKRWDVHASLSF